MTGSSWDFAAEAATWRREGCMLLPDFLPRDQMLAAQKDFEKIFGPPRHIRQAEYATKYGKGTFNDAQFRNNEAIPFDCSPALNLLAVHPKLIALAKQALGSEQVYLYQALAWAKYTGEADYEQPYHCDFLNHTLTVPSEDVTQNAITFIILVTDVTEAHGPTHYVTKSDSLNVAGSTGGFFLNSRLHNDLLPYSRSAAGPAGSVFAYGIDVYHRGTNLTVPDGYRYVVTSCFRKAANDTISYTAWAHSFQKPWYNIFNHATPEQLACFGVPLPGDPFWTAQTLKGAAERWPDWDMSAYRDAASRAAR